MEETLFFPGDFLGNIPDFYPGIGTYLFNNEIRSCLIGRKFINPDLNTISIINQEKIYPVISFGDKVICKVYFVEINFIRVNILSINNKSLKVSLKGILRKRRFSKSYSDSLKTYDCFRKGDIISAEVISSSDSKLIYLTVSNPENGVIYAKNENGKLLFPLNWLEMTTIDNLSIEKRLVAKPNLNLSLDNITKDKE